MKEERNGIVMIVMNLMPGSILYKNPDYFFNLESLLT